MAYWGVAEAVGPNYNDPASDERFAEAHDAIQKAVDLSANASPAEQAYIQAMALRFPADPKADRRQAAEAYHDAMREVVEELSRRSGCRHAVRRVRHEPASLGLVARGRNAGSRHRRNRRHARIGDQARSQPHGRDSLLHSRGRSLGVSGARAGRRQPTGRHGAGRRTPRAHAGPRLHSHRRLRSGGQNQPGSRHCGSRLHQGQRRAGHLSHDVLQPQSAFHRHVLGHERRLCRGHEECAECWLPTCGRT